MIVVQIKRTDPNLSLLNEKLSATHLLHPTNPIALPKKKKILSLLLVPA